ncbi:MAG: hypothetical protein LUG26_09095 [Ruminococcus sp.]|nr:hypothetical protein [Ruminococcus sp.]
MNETLASIFRTLSENAEKNLIENQNADDFVSDDGLLYCGKCGTPKQFRMPERFRQFGIPEIVGCTCAC